jgi:hypothetical protein
VDPSLELLAILLVSTIVTPHLAGMMPRMKVNARARMAAGGLDARGFPDISRFCAKVPGSAIHHN